MEEAQLRPGCSGLCDNLGQGSVVASGALGMERASQEDPCFSELKQEPLRERDIACGFPDALKGAMDDTAPAIPSWGGDKVAVDAILRPLAGRQPRLKHHLLAVREGKVTKV